MRLNSRLAIGFIAATLGLVTSHVAQASYTGTITRAVTGGSLIPDSGDRSYWFNEAYYAGVSDSNETAWHYGTYSIPVENNGNSTSVTFSADVYASGESGMSELCIQGLVYGSSGSLVSSTSVKCPALNSPFNQPLSIGSATLANGDAVLFTVQAQDGAKVYYMSAEWQVTGS